ncbi:hypothetical protein PIB30_079411 [Stylosanthes scabra]|uniref:Uncharacterized protein n=1 Tax=Stylosanthes scabra TaxID=79078 RepID=A0ABU6USV5_9FABA|nr:hypothetical protein [Stylosanthes scabra]
MALLISVLRGVICSGIFSGLVYHWSEPVISLITLLEPCRMIYMTKSRRLWIYRWNDLGVEFYPRRGGRGARGRRGGRAPGRRGGHQGGRQGRGGGGVDDNGSPPRASPPRARAHEEQLDVANESSPPTIITQHSYVTMDDRAGPSHAQHADPLAHEPPACFVPGPRSQSSQDTVDLAHDGVAPLLGTMTQWLLVGIMTSYPQAGRVPHVQLFSGMHDTPPVASSHVFSGMHGTPPVASPHAFAGSHTFNQLHGTPPGSHVTGSSSDGSSSHGEQPPAEPQPPAEQHDADEQGCGRRERRPPPYGTGGCLQPPAPMRRGRH